MECNRKIKKSLSVDLLRLNEGVTTGDSVRSDGSKFNPEIQDRFPKRNKQSSALKLNESLCNS